MSPPRFVQPGVVDIVAAYSPIGSHAGPASAAGQNLTAMPSNHYVLDVVGSAVLIAASVGAAAVWGRLVASRWT